MRRHGIFRWQLVALVVTLTTIAVWAASRREPAQAPTPRVSESPFQVEEEEPAAVAALEGTPDSRVRECQARLKLVATALEMWASDHSGHYPDDLRELQPTYLKSLPKCPSAGRDTYRKGYVKGLEAPHNESDFPDFYHLACSGHHHKDAGLEANLPALNARLGLLPEMPFLGSPAQARKACEENLKVIATTLEMYATDTGGHYPKSLTVLSPNYLGKVPHCPVEGTDTYSATLKVGPSAPGNSEDYKDYFYLECSGSHPESGSPCYDSVRGLGER